ncbi:MAG: dihydrolipoyl dehydrogenase [Candidatus Nitrososphaera sp. 13_1_40CM_48_12]|nr:MAG: dihydrolipoyl dehydrogenase [Candidatus Nitrososphaera sp. 13_1_40CM_48_12]
MYDAVVIGGGPGGYACAIRIAQLGGEVCIIEKNGLGGTCTQRGCIPTKYLHSIGEIMRRSSAARKDGLKVQIELDYGATRKRMISTVNRLAAGIKTLLESNDVDLLDGEGQIVSENKVMVSDKTIETRNIVIATGSYPVCLPGYRFENNILSTNTILELETLPKSIVIVGGGYSGCEFSAILNSFGCKVSLIEAQNHLLPLQIEEIGRTIEKYMRLDGISVVTGSSVEKILENGVVVNGQTIEAEKVLVCVGRRPSINAGELSRTGIKFNDGGIEVNKKMRTTAQTIFAIGDVTGIFELAHVASKQGEVAAQNIMGKESEMDYRTVPTCVFTYPEVAFVGKLEGRCGEFPLAASAKANCLGDTKGVFKVFEKDGIIVGALIIAPHAGEIIAEAALATRMRMKPQDIFDTIHAHPTLPESLVDATRDIDGEAIHIPRKNKKLNG